MSTKLHYFNLNGFAEPIRYILHYAGEKFEDIKYEKWDWPIKSVKDSLPYGQMPMYEEGGRSLTQSMAIARYVGTKAGLVPSDPWEQAILDATVLNLYDFWSKVRPYIIEQDPTKKEVLRKELFEEIIVFWFTRFEKELQAKNGFFGGKLSWADFVLVGIVECGNLILEVELEQNYPAIKALVAIIRSLPGVKEYIANREPYVFTL